MSEDSGASHGACKLVRAIVGVAVLIAAVADVPAQTLRRLTMLRPEPLAGLPAIDDAGDFVAAVTSEESPTNPDRRPRLILWDLVSESRTDLFDFDADPDLAPSLSDDGQWVVFRSSADPTGVNPQGLARVFLASADGSTLVQLDAGGSAPVDAKLSGDGSTVVVTTYDHLLVFDTATPSVPLSATPISAAFVSISDDGQRITFATGEDPLDTGESTVELFSIAPDGSDFSQVTRKQDVGGAWLSGNGEFIVYNRYHPLFGPPRLLRRSLADDTTIDLGPPQPWVNGLSDTGGVVVYQSGSGLFRQTINGGSAGTPIEIVTGLSPSQGDWAVLSGGGDWIALRQRGATFPGVDDPDGSGELIVLVDENQGVQQLTWLFWPLDDPVDYQWPVISADGSRIAAVVERRDGSRSIVTFDVEGEGAVLDPLVEGDRPFIIEDGSRIFFDSSALAQNDCERTAIYSIAPDGTGLARQSPPDPGCTLPYQFEPRLAEDGGRMVYTFGTGSPPWRAWETSNLDGTDPLSVPVPTSSIDASNVTVRIDGVGERFVFSDGFTTGQITPEGDVEVFPDNSNYAQADVSRDGSRVVYQVSVAPSEQAFVLDTASRTADQVTAFTSSRVRNLRISADGAWVFVYAEAQGDVGPPIGAYFRVSLAGGFLERVTAPVDLGWTVPDHEYDISADGQQVVFVDRSAESPEGDLWLTDLAAPRSIEIFASGHPAVRFPYDPRASTYDVVRGDLAALAFDGEGNADLGAVLCLADDTAFNESHDPIGDETPAPGQGFFYLTRSDFAMGVFGAGAETSYGTGNPSGERFASSGDCALP